MRAIIGPLHYTIDAKRIGNFTRFINHNYKPNVISRLYFDGCMWHTILVADCGIAKDEQLFIDYSRGDWNIRGLVPIDLQSNS